MITSPIKTVTNTSYNQNILGFVPSLIIQYLLNKESRKFPEKQSFKTVAMFADISGFTNLSETLQKRGNEGSELLAFVLNRYMELLIKSIGRSGGDIFKFAGDAMIVLWPPPKSEGLQLEQDLLTLCRQAVQSGIDIKNRLNGAVIFEKTISLSVKIGFGIGDVTIMHVGGVFQRAEYLPAGDPLTQAFECEHHATGGGQVIVSTQIWSLINQYFNAEQLIPHGTEESKNAPFYLVTNLKTGQSAVQTKADALLIRTKIGQGSIQAILPLLESYIPKALLPYIKIDQEKWSAELRRLSVMFLNLGVDLSAAKTEEGLDRIQSIIKTVQSCLYQNEGSLNKLLMDDKGSTLIVVFGLPPLSHQDDSVRGILAAFKLRQELSKINCKCSIGLTTGLVFTGVVGTSGNRREYSVLGDIVNLSARLMQAACSENEYKILVDEETKRDAENKIKFIFFEFRTVKGKSGQIPIYAPVNCLEENRKDMGEQLVLRTHLYNVPDDMLMIEQYKDSLYMLRREKELIFVKKMLDEFIKNEKSKLVLIRGEYGIGKTLFIRCVLEGLKMKLNSEQKLWNHETIFIFINRFTSLSQKKKLNGFRLFLQFSIEKLRIRFKVDHYTEIFKILQLKPENVKTIVNVLDLDPIAAAKKEIIIDKEKILKEETIILKEFMINIIKLLIEKNNSPLVLCFDDMQGFDEESWNFLIQILESFPKKIFLFCAIRDAHLESSVNLSIFHRYFKKLQKLMKFMKQDETIMFDSSLVQIHLKQINLVDSLELSRKICGSDIIPENLVHFLHHKTKGNPLKLIQLLQNLLESQLISKNINSIVISEEMSNLLYINEFLTLPLPLSSIKINNTILDRLNCKQILLMKAASIIGDTFSLIVLKKLNPFKDQAITNDEVENILKELEKIELIGIIDETESNITFQFNGVFMREVLYQRMTYNQRRELHKIFAETIQNFSTSLFLNTKAKAYEKVQCEKLMFHWKLAETKSADTTKNAFPLLEKEKISAPSNLSNLAKRSVIVKKISSLASTKFLNPLSTLKKDFLQYKFVNDFFYSKKFCVLSFKDLKIYPSEDEFLDKPEKSIGLISLKQIFSIVFISEKNRNVFSLQTGSFQTRENKDLGLVQLLFSHQDFDILEEWATYIEFARAKAIYDDFVNTFGKISFPLQSEQRIIKKERALRKKVKNKIDNPQSSLSIKINENKGLIDSLKDYGAQNVSYLQTKHQKLKESLNTLMNHGLLLFFSSLIENQGSEETKGKHFSYGKNTDFLKKFPELLTIKPSLLEEEDEESPQNYPIDNKLNDIPIRNNNSLIKKTVSIVELKSLKVFVKKTNKTSESILITNCEENLSDEDAKINEPSESINLLNRFTNMKSSGGVGSLNNEKNNTNKFFTFNSTHSLSLDLTANERRQSGGLEILKLGGSSILLPPTPKINFHNELSQIQEEDLENDQKLVNNQERQYKLKGTTQKRISDDKNQLLPLVFYSRKNSLKKKEFFKKEQKIKKNKKTKKLGSKVWVIMEFESEEKISLKRKSETNEGQNDIVSSSSLSIKNHFIGETKQNLVSSSLINNFLNETSKKSIKNAMDGSKTKIIGKINEISSLSLSRNFLDESKKLHSNQPSNMVKSMPKDMAISAVKLKKSSKDSLYIVKSSNIKDISFYSDLKESSFDEKKKNMQILEKNSSNEKKKIKGFSEKKMEESFEIVKIKNNDKFSYGFTLQNSISLEGDSVVIPKDELVVIMNIFKTFNKIECLWKGFIGIFASEDIEIVYMQNCHQIL